MDEHDADFARVVEALQSVLADARGKLRASDALLLAGFARPSYVRAKLVARAMRQLGWERGRYRFQGNLLYAYARGTELEREVMLLVERDAADQLVLRRKEPWQR